MMSAMYGESAFQKRRKMTSPIGRWFAVMFARNREVDGEVGRAERTRIRYTSHIGSIFFATAAAAFASSSSCSAGEENGEEEEEDAPRRMYLVANEEPSGGKEAPEDERAAAKKKTRGQWHVVLALGPMREESDANGVCRLWSLSQKGVISKAARGEAISIRFDIPGFVDWSTVFGSAEKLCRMYDILFYKNPCGGEPPCAEEIAKRKGNDGDRRSAEAEKT